MKLREKTKEQLIEEAFSIFNGGDGLDHWSYSSTSTPFAKNIIGYSFPQEVRRKFPFRYKANFGNLVNNVVQRNIADVIYTSKTTKETEWDKDLKVNFEKEKEIKFMLDYRFGLGTYDEMLGMRRKIRAEREETVYKAMEAKRQIQNNMAIGALSFGIISVLGGGMYLIVLVTQ